MSASATISQPPTEAVLGTPLQLRREGHEHVVEIRTENDSKVELKRFRGTK